ncbi:9740_t:CDS:1 [Paraglomus occultum]|uniref:9740_t:CDS:1 n=1 Tax=Paraglomus occultum TaxID=144539 RepID=A0A9N8ZK04_9GLOM|nr:9740_t:CDS:1 [Paraglomus occultum]
MTAHRPSNTQHPHSHSSDDMLKRKRGPINKRACERCRQGKVRCDGNAETLKPCSNCIPDQCVYDQSPRKNKQLEHMKQKLDNTESNLKEQKKQIVDQHATIRILQLEKKIMGMLAESANQYLNDKQVFQTLHKAVSESRVFENILFLIEECLGRLNKPDEQYSAVIDSLKHVAAATANLPPEVSIDVALGKRNAYVNIAADIDSSYRNYLATPSDQRNAAIQVHFPNSDESKKEPADSIDQDVIMNTLGISSRNVDTLSSNSNAMRIETVVSPVDIMSRSPSDCCTPSPQTSFPFENSVISPIELLSNVDNKFYPQNSYLSAPYPSSGSSTASTEYSWIFNDAFVTFE